MKATELEMQNSSPAAQLGPKFSSGQAFAEPELKCRDHAGLGEAITVYYVLVAGLRIVGT